jgi:glycerol-3-phosphate acyltransferase PlsX
MVTIAVDAMGGDHFPKPEVEGSIRAARAHGIHVALVGDESVVRRELNQHDGWRELPISVVHAPERIAMDDSAAKAARSKRESSMHVACRLVSSGQAQAFVSPGNTGACMAISKMVMGKIPGVDRPALSAIFPTKPGTPAVLVDVGANVDCSAEMLAQFAVMGEIYSRVVLKVPRPRVGLLSIGEEEHKGNELTRAVTPLLKSLPINFIGNVEGRDLYTGIADVIVCDGFIGNVALKVSEGLVETIRAMLRESLQATLTRQLGYALSKAAYRDFKKRVDYSEIGGAPLLGVKGATVICHGRSDANAIKNAIRVAKDFASGNLSHRIEAELRAVTVA